jgi:hypothetical protein
MAMASFVRCEVLIDRENDLVFVAVLGPVLRQTLLASTRHPPGGRVPAAAWALQAVVLTDAV